MRENKGDIWILAALLFVVVRTGIGMVVDGVYLPVEVMATPTPSLRPVEWHWEETPTPPLSFTPQVVEWRTVTPTPTLTPTIVISPSSN
jgi:hypothetical protein